MDDLIARMMARTIELLGPELAVGAGVDLRVQRIPRERRWLAGLGLGTALLMRMLDAGAAQLLLALVLSITIVRLLAHRALLHRLAPMRTLDADEMARWRMHVHALTCPPHPKLLQVAESQFAQGGPVRIHELAQACTQIAVAELRPRQ